MTGLAGIILIGLGVILIAMTIGFYYGRMYSEAVIDMFTSHLINRGWITLDDFKKISEEIKDEREGKEE